MAFWALDQPSGVEGEQSDPQPVFERILREDGGYDIWICGSVANRLLDQFRNSDLADMLVDANTPVARALLTEKGRSCLRTINIGDKPSHALLQWDASTNSKFIRLVFIYDNPDDCSSYQSIGIFQGVSWSKTVMRVTGALYNDEPVKDHFYGLKERIRLANPADNNFMTWVARFVGGEVAKLES